MLTASLPVAIGAFQGPIALEQALFCIECEVIFTDLARCPRCCSDVVWPLAGWLSPTQPTLVETPALLAAIHANYTTTATETMIASR
jgi:hypothetical protein